MPKRATKPVEPELVEDNLTDDQQLAVFVSQFYDDPLGYVKAIFPWGQPGELANEDGPDEWQTEYLITLGNEVKKRKFNGSDPVDPIRMAVSSGHGVGKSTITGWIVSWIMDTRPHSQGAVTANTGKQLETKTWASIKKWKQLAITAHWYDIGAHKIRHKDHMNTWFCSSLTSNEDKSEAFAGQHAANSTSYYIFDEASAIHDKIFEVASGGLTDGEPMMFMMGNPTKNSGAFYRAMFGEDKKRWIVRTIDSRRGKKTNKKLIQEMIDDWGEDSDYIRVRVLGLAPRASDSQFIAHDVVSAAMKRVPMILDDEPLVAGVDISRGGSDYTVVRFRQGQDAVGIPPIRITGEDSRDSMRTVSILHEVMNRDFGGGLKVSALFIDETGVGGPIGDRMRQMGYKNTIGVQFGGKSPITATANMRAYIWYQMRDWLKTGSIGDDKDLEQQLVLPGYSHNAYSAILLESKEQLKKRGEDSPDDADALAVTFAQTVVKRPKNSGSSARSDKIRRLRANSSAPWML